MIRGDANDDSCEPGLGFVKKRSSWERHMCASEGEAVDRSVTLGIIREGEGIATISHCPV